MAVIEEKYVAVVSSTDDPEKRGRIKVTCAQLLGNEEEELPMWVNPDYEWGWFIIPDVGEQVEISVTTSADDDEQIGQMTINALNPRWRARYWGNEEAEEEELKRPIPEDFTASNYGKRRGFATPQGHIIMFDDTPDDPKVSITWATGDPTTPDEQERAFLTFDKQGVTIATKPTDDQGFNSSIFMNGVTGETLWVDAVGNSIGTTADGIKITQSENEESKASIELKSDGIVTVLSAAGVVFNTKNIHANAGEILLGSGLAAAIIEPAVLGNILINLLGTHTHPTGVGPSGPPVGGPAFFTAALAQEVKVK